MLHRSKSFLYIFCFLVAITSCSVSRKISNDSTRLLLTNPSISQGHIGISIFDPATGNYLYNHNAEKYFIPASNTKLFTLYAGMKYLGDSLTGLRYVQYGDSIFFYPNGDPSFLHPDFKNQRIYEFLKKPGLLYCMPVFMRTEVLGKGWSWDDYMEPFMPERSAFPVYGNMATINRKFSTACLNTDSLFNTANIIPSCFHKRTLFDDPDISRVTFLDSVTLVDFLNKNKQLYFDFRRELYSNFLHPKLSFNTSPYQKFPFSTSSFKEIIEIVKDTLHRQFDLNTSGILQRKPAFKKLYSKPADSLFIPMMRRSDNFFAEQTLLMVSNELFNYMSDEETIDSLLKSDLKDIPQKPRWVDGSGLSRYNLFSPKDFIYILNKIKNEFGLERLKKILPTGGQGTLKDYFITDSSFIYAKTGTLSNNSSLCGFLITKKSRLLIFSVMANNYLSTHREVRKAVEKFIITIRDKY